MTSAGGIKLNGKSTTISLDVNATNEITTPDRPNPAGAAAILNVPFNALPSYLWTEDKGTWIVGGPPEGDKYVTVTGLTSGNAVLLTVGEPDTVNIAVDVEFPASSSTNKAGLIFAHDGNNRRVAQVVSTWGLDSISLPTGSWAAASGGKQSLPQVRRTWATRPEPCWWRPRRLEARRPSSMPSRNTPMQSLAAR